ncbi:MAG TPA: hypothetical protein VGH88_19725 [Streptosporangiaceae bacterium]|jgi:pyruvate-formate lyase
MNPVMMEELSRQRRQELAAIAARGRRRRSRRPTPAREAAGWLLVRAGLALVVR